MSGFTKRMAGLMLALCMAVSAAVGYYSSALPDSFYISKGGSLDLGPALCAVFPEEQAAPAGTFKDNVEKCSIRLFGMIPVKKAEVITTEAPVLIPGGTPIGIKLLTDGVVVVSTNEKGPAAVAGIAAGDSIISANGETLSSSDRLAEIIMNSHGDELCLSVRRGSREFKTSLKPEFSDSDGTFKAGIWIKDSSAGVGTMTYIDPATGSFGALGHPISDSESGKILPLGSGEVVDVTITGCDKGSPGCPGELYGTFLTGLAAGNIRRNCEQGVFGTLNYRGSLREPIPMAFKAEIHPGPAKILTTVEGSTPGEYSVEIEKVSLTSSDTKNMVIKVTDPELLKKTGGIVQGMSGSPIIQDGKLVGAVTHVFVSDPERGYGIFIENMLSEANRKN